MKGNKNKMKDKQIKKKIKLIDLYFSLFIIF